MQVLYTPEEIAEKLKISKRTLYVWLQSGQLQGVKIGNLWRVTPEALEAFTGLKWDDSPALPE